MDCAKIQDVSCCRIVTRFTNVYLIFFAIFLLTGLFKYCMNCAGNELVFLCVTRRVDGVDRKTFTKQLKQLISCTRESKVLVATPNIVTVDWLTLNIFLYLYNKLTTSQNVWCHLPAHYYYYYYSWP